jgi:hypothetical protein
VKDWIIEVKYVRTVRAALHKAEQTLWQISAIRSQVEPAFRDRLALVLAVVTKFRNAEEENAVEQRLKDVASALPFETSIRVFDVSDLQGIEPLLLEEE